MRLQREDGVVAVEFALIVPIFLLIVAGIVEFAVMLYNQQIITNASREGARAGIIMVAPKPSDTALKDSIQEYVVKPYLADAGLDTASATVITTVEGQDFGDDITVQVQYLYDFLFFRTLKIVDVGPFRLNAITTMKHE